MKNEKSEDLKLETHKNKTFQQDLFFHFLLGSLKPSFFRVLSELL
jgi:hypothetical protein